MEKKIWVVIIFVFLIAKGGSQNSSNASKVDSLLKTAHSFFKTNQDSALFYSNIAYKKSLEFNDSKLIAKSIIYKNTCLIAQKKYDEAETLFDYNFKHINRLTNGTKGDTYYNYACLKYLTENFDLALENFLQSIIYYEKANLKGGLRKAYLQIGVIYSKFNRADLSQYFYNKSKSYGDNGHDSKNKTSASNKLLDRERLIVLQKMLEGVDDINNSRLAAIVYYNIGQSYFNLKDYKNVIQANLNSLDIKNRINYISDTEKSLAFIGESYSELNNYGQAINYLNKAYHNSVKRQFKLRINRSLSLAYEKAGDYKNALRVSKDYNVLKDSLNLVQENERIAEITAKYENEKQVKEILILKQENQESQILIAKKESSMWKWLLFALLATIVSALLFRKLVGSLKHIKKVEQEKEQIAKKVEEIAVILNNKSKIYLDKLKYIKSDGNYLEFVTDDKTIIDRNKLKDILDDLPPNFVRVHRSYVINKNFIDALNSTTLYLKSNIEIPLSRTFKSNLALHS